LAEGSGFAGRKSLCTKGTAPHATIRLVTNGAALQVAEKVRFVSGHDFSRIVKDWENVGLYPLGYVFLAGPEFFGSLFSPAARDWRSVFVANAVIDFLVSLHPCQANSFGSRCLRIRPK
jgi:hypothetical protein